MVTNNTLDVQNNVRSLPKLFVLHLVAIRISDGGPPSEFSGEENNFWKSHIQLHTLRFSHVYNLTRNFDCC
jgi:hypothetical protein